MKLFTLLFFLLSVQYVYAGYVKCSNSPKKHGYKKAKYGIMSNFKKKGMEEWKKIKDIKKRVKNCSIYSGIKSDVNKWYRKARDYKDWSQTKGDRGQRKMGANCLAEVNDALVVLGRKATGFSANNTSGMGTSSHDYGGTSVFNWKDHCAGKPSNSGGKKGKCPTTTTVSAKNVRGLNKKKLTAKFIKKVSNKCMYSIDGKGSFVLYTK